MNISYTQHAEKSRVSYVDYAMDAIKRSRYWKEEAAERTWKTIPDTPEAVAEAVRLGAMFISTPALSEMYSDKYPDKEIMRYDDLLLDFDDKLNPANALRDLRILIGHLDETYNLNPYSIALWCSGGKGFHARIPAGCLGSQAGDVYLPLIYKKMAVQWKVSLELPSIDTGIYCTKRGNMFRIENVKRSNCRYKVPITLDELQSLDFPALWELSKNPREIEPVEEEEDVSAMCEDLATLYQGCKEQVHAEIAEQKKQPPVDLKIIGRLQGKVAPCVNYILTSYPKTAKTNFNTLVMNLVKYFQNTGSDLNNTLHVVESFLKGYPHSTSYTSYNERLKHFKEQWAYHQGRTDSHFNCSYIKGYGLKGSAFDCKECQAKAAETIEVWGKPEPLLNSIPNAPMLPIDCLPGVILDFCTDTAERMQVQIESVLVIVLVAFAGCIGKNALLSPRAKDTWKERICLWACLILPPGMKKSPLLDAGLLPLKRIQAHYANLHLKELEDWNKAFSASKQRQKAWEKSCSKVLSKNPSAELGEDPMLALPPKPSPRRTYTADCTIEKMVDIMNRSPGLTQVSDELSGFLLNMNRYSKGSDRQFYLKCKTGGGHPVDRVGRGEEFVDDLYLNIVGGIQPKVAKRLFSPKDGEGDDGFFERFGLVVYPNPMTSYEHVDRYPNKNALQNYYNACEKLAGCNWAEQLIPDEHLPEKGTARFDAQAQEAFNQWDVKHGRAMLSQHDDDSLNTMLSKAPGLLVQLAFLFHLADWADNVCVDVSAVNFRSFDRARVFLENYLIPMWKRILFAFADDGGESAAQKIGKWLVQESIKSFTVRDIKQKHWVNLKNNDEIEVSIVVLLEKNWIMEAGKRSTGGRSTVKYAVNPAIYETVT